MFPYIKAHEAKQYSFYQIPKELITNPMFKNVSTDAKLLYGIMLDRMSLSVKNKWVDDNGNVYIYFVIDEIREHLNCGVEKAVGLLAELDGKKGIGLIERKKQGQGKPTMIFVKNFMITGKIQTSEKPRSETAQTSEKPKSRLSENRSLDFGESKGNNTDLNDTDFIETDPFYSFQGNGMEGNGSDEYEIVVAYVKDQIEYENLSGRKEVDQDCLLELMQIMVEVLMSNSNHLFVDGDMRPIALVKEQYRKIDSEVILHVLNCLGENTSNVRKVKNYLRTCLYNAPTTFNTQIKMQVNHDMNKGNPYYRSTGGD